MRLLQVTPLDEALSLIEETFQPLAAETVELSAAGGRFLAAPVRVLEDVPTFDRSTVDGYAVRAEETFGAGESLPALFELVEEVRMGGIAPGIAPGEAAYVPTGGMLPKGADAVVMIEDTMAAGPMLHVLRQVAPGENRIRRGEDLARGQILFERSRKLRAPELGLLAALGITRVEAVRRPVIGLFASGDELTPETAVELQPGQIRDANTPALAYMAAQMGAVVKRGGIIPDSYEAMAETLAAALPTADMIVLSGGSSVGSRDYTAQVLREMGNGLLLEGLAIQPGKPTLLADAGGRPILGLPGHPVSALNVFALIGAAIIRRLSGAGGERFRPVVRASLGRNVPSRPGRTDFIRVALAEKDNGLVAEPIFGRSGLLHTLAAADGIVEIPPESDGLAAGETVEVFLWD